MKNVEVMQNTFPLKACGVIAMPCHKIQAELEKKQSLIIQRCIFFVPVFSGWARYKVSFPPTKISYTWPLRCSCYTKKSPCLSIPPPSTPPKKNGRTKAQRTEGWPPHLPHSLVSWSFVDGTSTSRKRGQSYKEEESCISWYAKCICEDPEDPMSVLNFSVLILSLTVLDNAKLAWDFRLP